MAAKFSLEVQGESCRHERRAGERHRGRWPARRLRQGGQHRTAALCARGSCRICRRICWPAFRAIKNIAVVCVIAKLRKAVTENFWLNTNDPEMDIPGLVEYTQPAAAGPAHRLCAVLHAGRALRSLPSRTRCFSTRCARYLKKINPALTDDDFIDLRASRYRYAQPICDPGYLDKLPPVALAGTRALGGGYVVLLPGRPGDFREHRFRAADGEDGCGQWCGMNSIVRC